MAPDADGINIRNPIALGERLLNHVIESANNDPDAAPKHERGGSQKAVGDLMRIVSRNGEVKHVHRIISSSVLPKLMELVENEEGKAATIRLDVLSEVMDIVLNFVYTTQDVMIPSHLILESFAFAKRFDIEDMANGISRVMTLEGIEGIIRREDCLDTVSDRDMSHLSELLLTIDLSSDQKLELLKKIHRWSKLQENRTKQAFDLSASIVNPPGISTSNGSLTGLRDRENSGPSQNSAFETHFLSLDEQTRTMEIYRLQGGNGARQGKVRSFQISDIKLLLGSLAEVYSINYGPRSVAYELQDEYYNGGDLYSTGYGSHRRRSLMGTVVNRPIVNFCAVLRGDYFLSHAGQNMLRLYRIRDAPNNEAVWAAEKLDYFGLTSSGNAIYTWSRSAVFEVVNVHILELKSVIKHQSIGRVFGLNPENRTQPLLAIQPENDSKLIFFRNKVKYSELAFDRNRNILAVSCKYVLWADSKDLWIHEHDFKTIKSPKRVVLKDSIHGAAIENNQFLVRVRGGSGHTVFKIHGDDTQVVMELPERYLGTFLRIIPE